MREKRTKKSGAIAVKQTSEVRFRMIAFQKMKIQQIEADRLKAENAAKLREDDYQLAYAIDILSGLSAISTQN